MRSPGYRAGRALNMALFPPKDPTQREVTPQTVSSLTLDDVKQYYARTVRPDLATIVVIGDVTPEEARATIEKYFGSWKADAPKPDVDLPQVPPNKPSVVNVPDPSQLQVSVDMSETIPINRFDPDYYPLQLGNHVLGGGFYATRLYHDLRQVNGYVYSVDVRLNAQKTRAIYTVSYGCDPQNVLKARDLILHDLMDVQKENVTEAELQQAKALLLRQIPLAESSEDGLAGGMLARAQIGLGLDEPAKGAKQYFGMTADQIRLAFAKWIRPDDFVLISRGPAPK
jgi:zinc protease